VLTDALTAAPLSSVSTEDLTRMRARLVTDLQSLTDEGDDVGRLRIGSYELATALRHPERCGEREAGFTPSPLRCRRAVGIAAVERCARRRASSPAAAVADVLDSSLEDVAAAKTHHGAPRPPWWAEWYSGLSAGGRAVLHAEAVTWATQLWCAVEWDHLERPPVVGGRDDWWECPGRPQLVLHGRADVRAWTGRRQALLLVGSGFPRVGWQKELAFPALVAALARGERSARTRVVGLWPSSGMVRICEVDEPALSEAAAAVVAAVGRYVEARGQAR